MLGFNRKIPSVTNTGASATTAAQRERMIFAGATLTNQSINNGLIRTTNTVAWSGGNGGNGSSVSIITDLEAGAVNTTLPQYYSYIASVPRLPKIPPPPQPNTTLASVGCNIEQYDNDGYIQWATDISGVVSNHNLTTDGTNVYAVGDFSGSIIFVNTDGTQLVTAAPISTVANGSYIVKYNSNGIAQWASYLTSQTYLKLIANLTDGVNSYQAGTFFTNLNIYDSTGLLYPTTLKPNVNLFNAAAITSDGTYIYIIDSNPTAYKFKPTGEIVNQKNLSSYGLSTPIPSIVWLAGYLYINGNRTIIWQLNTTFLDPPVKFITNTNYPNIDGVFSITTNYTSALYMVNLRTPNVLARAIVNNSTTPPSLTSVTFKGINNISGLGDAIIFPFGVSYTNHGTLSNGHLLITDYNNGHYADISGIIWDVAGVDTAGNWAPSGNLFLNVNTYTGTGRYINVPKSVNCIYADPSSYNIYISLYGTNNFVKYIYQKPGFPNGPKITNLGDGTLLFNITKLNNTFYTLNFSGYSTLYSVNYPTSNKVISKQVYPLAGNYKSGLLLKNTSSGAVSWVTEIGASNANCTVTAIAIGPTGIYVTGTYGPTGNLVFYNPPGDLDSGISLSSVSSVGGLSVFVAKYTTNGNAVWAVSLGNLNTASATAIFVDTNDNVYATGTYNGNRMSGPFLVYPPNSLVLQTAPVITINGYNSGTAAYLVKFNKSGVAQWGTNIIGTTTNTINALTGTTSNIYLVGTTSGNLTCYSTNQTSFGPITIAPEGNGVIVNYNSAGVVKWVTIIFGGVPLYITNFQSYLYLSGNMTADTTTYDVPYDLSGAVIPPPNGQPISSGVTIPVTGAQNDFLIAYDTYGITQWADNTSAPYLTQSATGGLTFGKNVEYVATSISSG